MTTLSPENYAFLDKLFPEIWTDSSGSDLTQEMGDYYVTIENTNKYYLVFKGSFLGRFPSEETAKAAARKHQLETIAQGADLGVLDQTHIGTMWCYWAAKCRELAEKNAALRGKIPVWRDIDEKAKDGRTVILFRPHYKIPIAAYFVQREEKWCEISSGKLWNEVFFQHWMPLEALPTPPETEK